MTFYLYVSNPDYPDVASLANELDGDDHRVEFRNPVHFSDANELQKADKVYLYGKYDKVEQACKKSGNKLIHLAYNGKQIPATPDSKIPSEDWSKEQLVEVARANGINATTRWKKSTIVAKLNETYNA